MSAVRLIAPLLVALLLTAPLTFAHHGDGDNGSEDGGNSRSAAVTLANGRYLGSVGGSDNADWFKFHIDTVTGDAGLPLLDIQVRSQSGWAPGLNLYGPGDTDDREPQETGRGSGGLRFIRNSIDEEGTHLIRITGNGHYELRFFLGPENDAGLQRDAPNNVNDALNLAADKRNGETFVEGQLTQADAGDAYQFQAAGRVLVALYRAPGSGFGIALTGAGQSALNPAGLNSDANMVTAYLDSGSTSATWKVRITNPNGAEGPYRFIIRINAPTNGDADQGADAPNPGSDLTTTYELQPGLRVAKLETDAPADLADVYMIKNVRAGDILRLGVSSHEGGALRLQVTATLYDTNKKAVQTLDACQGLASIVRTANQTGTWFLRVREAGSANRCDLTPTGGGPYSMALQIQKQLENGDQDAPADLAASGEVDLSTDLRGWLDTVDTVDSYRLGSLTKGQTVRATYRAQTEGLAAEILLLDAASNVVSSIRTSGGGTRLEATAANNALHYVQVKTVVDDDNPAMAGFYELDIISLPNQPPLVVSLSDPSDADVGRNTVTLRWSRNTDTDFAKYEVHAGTSGDFVPSQGTLQGSIEDQALTSHTVTGLIAGRAYTFLIRVVDDSGLFTDSNRRTETTDSSIIGNTAPTLANGRVSPGSGGPSTNFTYRVVYTDAENDTPSVRRLYIDGAPVDMQNTDTTYTNGAEFTYSTTLAPGVHSFYFEFNDGTAGARNPATGTHAGPEVTRDDNRPPTVDASGTPSSGQAPLRVQFSATATDPENGVLTYAWDFDNSNGFSTESTARQPAHTYTEPGTYTATVRVTDDRGATSTDSVTIDVTSPSRNRPTTSPSATPSSGVAPLTVQFRANANDSDGRIVSYAWDFDNGDGIQADSTVADPTHTYARAGSFAATVTVTDDAGGTATGSVTVIVRTAGNQPPTVRITADPQQGDAPLLVDFSAAAGDPDGEAVTVTWDFDLSDGVGTDATGLSVDHLFDTPGTYTVLATAKDPSGAAATDSTVITVVSGGNGTSPVRIVAEPREGRAPLTVSFRAESNESGLAFTDYLWDFGDGSPTDANATPSHLYDRSGRFVVSLRATTEDGTHYAATTEIVVSGRAEGGSPGVPFTWLLLGLLALGVLVRRHRRRPGP